MAGRENTASNLAQALASQATNEMVQRSKQREADAVAAAKVKLLSRNRLSLFALSKAAFIGPEFTSNSVTRQGYTIAFSAGPVAAKSPASCNGVAAGASLQTYFFGADPLSVGPSMGTRHFGMNQTGAIYQSAARINAFYTGTPPSPAKIVQ